MLKFIRQQLLLKLFPQQATKPVENEVDDENQIFGPN